MIQIKNNYSGKVIFESEAGTMKEAVEEAARKGADLRGANLWGADLWGADLGDANLRGADLWGVNLEGANLVGADLQNTNLYEANLTEIKKDFLSKLTLQKTEAQGLYKTLLEGRIDGSCYEGECCCFVGTLAKVKGVHYEKLDVKPDANSPTEVFFMGIRKGDIPKNNPVSAIVKGWVEEFLTDTVSEIIPQTNSVQQPINQSVSNEKRQCSCDFRSLMMAGCKCGGI